MIPLLTAAQVRELDRLAIEDIGLPGVVLMEGAGRALAREVEAVLPEPGRVAIACGKGNNAGDGFVAARILSEMGYNVAVYLTSPRSEFKGDAATNLEILRHFEVSFTGPCGESVYDDDGRPEPDDDVVVIQMTSIHDYDYGTSGSLRNPFPIADVIVDCLLGTGAKGAPRDDVAEAIDLIRDSYRLVIACDLPTGVDSDTGQVHEPHVVADRTCSFAAWKIGLAVGPAAVACGQVTVHDIGIPHSAYAAVAKDTPVLLQAEDVAGLLPERGADLHKGDAGRVVILGGSPGFGGAPILSATAALKTGSGLVTLGLPESLAGLLPAVPLEAMCRLLPCVDGGLTVASLESLTELLKSADAVAVGPGLGTAAGAAELLQNLSRRAVSLVIDADALNLLAADPKLLGRRAVKVLTPHPGEAARLLDTTLGKVQADRLGAALKLASKYGATVVLKGHHTVVAQVGEPPAVIPTGTPAMATGGMGDALTGVIASLLGQGLPPFAAACLGVWLHGSAGELAAKEYDSGLRATELIDALPAACQALLAVE